VNARLGRRACARRRRACARIGLQLRLGWAAAAAIVLVGAFGVAVGAAAIALPDRAAATHGYFKTPSANIVCGYGSVTGSVTAGPYVGCRIKSRLKPQPPGTPPGCWSTGDFFLRATGRTTMGRTICPGDDEGDAGVFVFESRARVLAYSKTWTGGGLRCTSAFTGLTCRNKSGHGFFLSRERWRAF
jgi:hypothetical protein